MVHYRTHKLPIVNQMKLLLITLSILLTSSPLFGQETGVLYLWENGTKYMGEWKDGKRHGQGNMTYHDGRKYVGEWKDGGKNGQGTFTSPDGEKYVGEWKDNKFHGQGTYTFGKGEFDGNKYVGEFREDEIWNITVYDKNGNIIDKYVNGVRQLGNL